jgi:hypothetical protein
LFRGSKHKKLRISFSAKPVRYILSSSSYLLPAGAYKGTSGPAGASVQTNRIGDQQLSRHSALAFSRTFTQRMVDRLRPTESDDGDISRHGLSPQEVLTGLPPRYAAGDQSSSLRFPLSSEGDGGVAEQWIAFEKYASFESDDHTVQANGMRAPSLVKVCGTAN